MQEDAIKISEASKYYYQDKRAGLRKSRSASFIVKTTAGRTLP